MTGKRTISAGWQTDARKVVLTQMFPAGVEAQRIRSRLVALPGPPPPPWPKVREYARRVLKLNRPGGDAQTVDTAEDARIADQIRAASARFVAAGLKWAEQRRTETPARAG